MAALRVCSVPACSKPYRAKGFCHRHYYLMSETGDIVGRQAENGLGLAFANAAITAQTDACIIWPYGISGSGYGSIKTRSKQMSAHRYVCLSVYGPQSSSMHACHRCGVRRCINPRHLYWGTAKDNDADKDSHGTRQRGTKHPRARLTESDVRAIRANPNGSSGAERAAMAKRYGVSTGNIAMIWYRGSWRHI